MSSDIAPGERSAWIQLIVAVIGWAAYAAVVLIRRGSAPLAEAAYAVPLLVTAASVVVVSVALHAALGAFGGTRDERDLLIEKWAERIGHAFAVLGAVIALSLALAEAAHFWIANTIAIGLVASLVFASIARIWAYRKGFDPTW
ncbi:hypothetical protein [Microbacterium sp.]|uniref:hypothetical protein n=1 Tax=Microbacterium sp. TaxID=51671 RepID=UPI003F9B0DD7